jgi:putative ABC transport system substrate-binding protein
MAQDQLQGVVVTVDGLFYANKEQVGALGLKYRLPTIVYSRETLEGAALMSYGPNQATMLRRAAQYVDRILKGEKPADIPVDQPTSFELIINRTVAKALDLKIPQSVIVRADDRVDIDCRRVAPDGICTLN